MSNQNEFKERINYTIENGRYCGHGVNIPIIAEAESLEQLEKRMKTMAKLWVKMMAETVDKDLFYFVKKPLIDTSPTTWQEHLQIMAGLTEKQVKHIEDNYEPLIRKNEKDKE